MKYWYEEDIDNLPSVVFELVQGLKERYVNKLKLAWDEAGSYYSQSTRDKDQSIPITTSNAYNVTRIAADTVATRMLVDKPAPKVLTTGAKEETQQRALKLEHLVLGAMQNANFDIESAKAQLDGIINGVGWVKVFSDNKKIIISNIPTENVLLDPTTLDAVGSPYSIFQTARLHPAEIKAIYDVDVKDYQTGEGNIPYVDIVEGWRRRVGETKGKHIICSKYQNLIEPEDYDSESFPLIPYKPEHVTKGWWTTGLGLRLIPAQRALNFIDMVIQGGMERWSTPILVLPETLNSQQMENLANPELYQAIMGDKPGWLTPPIVSQELLSIRDRIKSEALESVGVGPYQATGVKPPGLNSGVAISWHYDIESQQLSKYLAENERFVVSVARSIIREAKYLSELDSEWSIKFKQNKLYNISWKDVSIDEDQYSLAVQVSSQLPHLFSGRVEIVKDLANSGLIQDPKLIRQLLRLPDLDSWQDLDEAPVNAIQLMLDDIMAGAEHLPEKYDDVESAMKLGLQYLAKAKVNKSSDKVKENLKAWCDECDRLMKPPKPEAIPQGPGPMPILPAGIKQMDMPPPMPPMPGQGPVGPAGPAGPAGPGGPLPPLPPGIIPGQ